MSDSIDETIKIIEAELQSLKTEMQEKQAALKVLYGMAGRSAPSEKSLNGVSVFAASQPPKPEFPKNSRTDKQVMFLFNNIFHRAQKFSTIQKKYNELAEGDRNVYNVCRALKKMGLLATVQYNKQNKMSFWGKGAWLGETDFKDDFKPDPEEMPIEVFDIKILTDEPTLAVFDDVVEEDPF